MSMASQGTETANETHLTTRQTSTMHWHVWRTEVERLRRLVKEPALKWPKLLVLDLNGLLVWRTPLRPRPGQRDGPIGACYQRQPDVVTKRFCIWRRPGAVSFMRYVLAWFHVGIWSTAQLPNVEDILATLLTAEQRRELVFVMDQKDCTKVSRAYAPGSSSKPLMLKDLERLWSRYQGFYHMDNTLLIDDDPYKASVNPVYTSVHPSPWKDPDVQGTDTFLCEGGRFRAFLEALLHHDGSVRTFVANQQIIPVEQTSNDDERGATNDAQLLSDTGAVSTSLGSRAGFDQELSTADPNRSTGAQSVTAKCFVGAPACAHDGESKTSEPSARDDVLSTSTGLDGPEKDAPAKTASMDALVPSFSNELSRLRIHDKNEDVGDDTRIRAQANGLAACSCSMPSVSSTPADADKTSRRDSGETSPNAGAASR